MPSVDTYRFTHIWAHAEHTHTHTPHTRSRTHHTCVHTEQTQRQETYTSHKHTECTHIHTHMGTRTHRHTGSHTQGVTVTHTHTHTQSRSPSLSPRPPPRKSRSHWLSCLRGRSIAHRPIKCLQRCSVPRSVCGRRHGWGGVLPSFPPLLSEIPGGSSAGHPRTHGREQRWAPPEPPCAPQTLQPQLRCPAPHSAAHPYPRAVSAAVVLVFFFLSFFSSFIKCRLCVLTLQKQVKTSGWAPPYSGAAPAWPRPF